MNEQKMREAFEDLYKADSFDPAMASELRYFSDGWASAQQPAAAVELTDDEIQAVFDAQCAPSEITIRYSTIVRVIRAAISAHEAKKNGETK